MNTNTKIFSGGNKEELKKNADNSTDLTAASLPHADQKLLTIKEASEWATSLL